MTLAERRASLLDKFILKTAKNPRFSNSWFPRGVFHHHNLRRELNYEEKNARTETLYKSPSIIIEGGLTRLTNMT